MNSIKWIIIKFFTFQVYEIAKKLNELPSTRWLLGCVRRYQVLENSYKLQALQVDFFHWTEPGLLHNGRIVIKKLRRNFEDFQRLQKPNGGKFNEDGNSGVATSRRVGRNINFENPEPINRGRTKMDRIGSPESPTADRKTSQRLTFQQQLQLRKPISFLRRKQPEQSPQIESVSGSSEEPEIVDNTPPTFDEAKEKLFERNTWRPVAVSRPKKNVDIKEEKINFFENFRDQNLEQGEGEPDPEQVREEQQEPTA